MQKKIVQVIPLTRLKRGLDYFDYLVPEELIKQVKKGQLIDIPFRNKIIKGVIFNFGSNSEMKISKLKSIIAICDPGLRLKKWQLDLIVQIAKDNFVSMSLVLAMMIPQIPKRNRKTDYDFFSDNDFLKLKKKNTKIDQAIKYKKPVLIKYVSYEHKINSYKELIKKAIDKKKQVVIIAPQIIDVRNIYKYLEEFKDKTSVFLNDMPKNLYWQEWSKINQGEVNLIIGTRSAIFAPFKNLHVIIIDQEENENHKQEEPNPRYNVKDVAWFIAQANKSKLLLYSNAPSLLSLNNVHQKDWQYYELEKFTNKPEIIIIDKQDEFRKGNYENFSEELIKQIDYHYKRARKMFLFLNRKGKSTYVTCNDCGYVATCPTCKLPLTLHDNKKLICHHCSFEADIFLQCPKCKSPQIKITGTGTEKIEAEIRTLYPTARVLKLDQETPFIDQKTDDYDIIIGTQYAFNYINWPQIDLIGVVNADTGFNIPDFRSAEKTFSKMVKLASFVNSKDKVFLVQTFSPEHYVFEALRKIDLKSFYVNEIKERKMFNYPPYSSLLKLIYQSFEFNAGKNEINAVYQEIKVYQDNEKLIIIPPLLAYTQQIRGRWRWQIVIKKIYKNVDLDFLKKLPDNLIINNNPENLL